MHDERDETLERIVAELKSLPPVPVDATARVLARVDAARRTGRAGEHLRAHDDDDIIYFPTATDEIAAGAAERVAVTPSPTSAGRARRLVLSLPAAIGYALAATLAGFLIRGVFPSAPAGTDGRPPLAAAPSVATEPAIQGSTESTLIAVADAPNRLRDEVPVRVQFILAAPQASRVALVGDFNGWDPSANLLRRDADSGIWSAQLPISPGRHVYAFVVDDSVRMLDPRAPRAVDPDYGTEQSVIIVGIP